MFTITKKYSFEASHQLVHHDGKCARPHGHSYQLEVELAAAILQQSGPKQGMVVDFGDIDAAVNPLLASQLDHHWLNDTLESDSPTAEYIAQWIYNFLLPHLPQLKAITVYETATSRARYQPDP